MLRVPEGSNVSEELISLTFVAIAVTFVVPLDPGDRDKHYAVRRHLGDSGSTACILSRHHFDQLRKLHGTRLRRVGPRDPHQLRFGWQRVLAKNAKFLIMGYDWPSKNLLFGRSLFRHLGIPSPTRSLIAQVCGPVRDRRGGNAVVRRPRVAHGVRAPPFG